MAWCGSKPISLPNRESRKFLVGGDSVVLSGYYQSMDTGSDLENAQDRYYQLSTLTSSQGLLVILRELGTL